MTRAPDKAFADMTTALSRMTGLMAYLHTDPASLPAITERSTEIITETLLAFADLAKHEGVLVAIEDFLKSRGEGPPA